MYNGLRGVQASVYSVYKRIQGVPENTRVYRVYKSIRGVHEYTGYTRVYLMYWSMEGVQGKCTGVYRDTLITLLKVLTTTSRHRPRQTPLTDCI